MLSIKIDNLTSTLKLNRALILSEIIKENHKNYNLKYNNEKFPGLFIKFLEGTLILFYTGNIIAVGCKNLQDLQYLFEKLKTIVLGIFFLMLMLYKYINPPIIDKG